MDWLDLAGQGSIFVVLEQRNPGPERTRGRYRDRFVRRKGYDWRSLYLEFSSLAAEIIIA
jgi:hypothetical protein